MGKTPQKKSSAVATLKRQDLLTDLVAHKVGSLMVETELGKQYGAQAVLDICRAFACNLRRLQDGKWKLEIR